MSKLEQSIFSIMSGLAREHEAINLGQGFPNFDCHEKLKALATRYMNAAYNQYSPMPGILELRNVIANKMNHAHGLTVDPENEVTVTAGATQALYTAISSLVSHGDEVIVFEPAYDSYIPSILSAGGVPKTIELFGPEFKYDWGQVQDSINSKTKMIIVNSPHNPTGQVLTYDDLNNLAYLIQDTDITILSDEVYEHLVYDSSVHLTPLAHNELAGRTLAVYSFGKTFHVTGWKMGYIIGPDTLMKQFRELHQWTVFCVNSFLQYAIAEYLKDEMTYLSLSGFYKEKRDRLIKNLESSELIPIACQGTYFQLFDYSQISTLDDFSFAQCLVKEHGVASIPLSPFYQQLETTPYIRLCFAKTNEVLDAAAERLLEVKGI